MAKAKNIRCLILAGGLGTRLSKVVSEVPKPLAPIGDLPFLDYLLQYLSNSGFSKVSLLTGFKSGAFESRYSDPHSFENLSIDLIKEETPLGTGGAIKNAISYYDEDEFLIINGDSFFGIDYSEFLSLVRGPVTLALSCVEDTSRYGAVELNDNVITRFVEKGNARAPGLINGGIIYFKREIFDNILSDKFSYEFQVLEKNANSGLLNGIKCNGPFIDIGTPSDYQLAQESLPKWVNSKF